MSRFALLPAYTIQSLPPSNPPLAMRKLSQRATSQYQKKRSIQDALEEPIDVHHHQSWRQDASRPRVTHSMTTATTSTSDTASAIDATSAVDTPSFDLGPGHDIFSPPSVLPHSHLSVQDDDDDDLYMDPEMQQATEEISSTASDDPMAMWRDRADTYLAELLLLEAPRQVGRCQGLSCNAIGTFQCLTCADDTLYCQACVVFRHKHLYLHRMQYWTGRFFWKTTLADLGLRVQVGHPPGEACCNPFRGDPNFTIIDVDGIYRVNIDYCNCHMVQPRDVQLLRSRLYPATSVSPETCATFRCLETFQIMSFMSKVSAYEFYWSLSRLTENLGTHAPPNRYQPFLRMIRQWRHLKLTKRMGRGNEPSGRAGTKLNDLVIKCPACPQPGINMPDIATILPEKRWLYRLFLAIDANFRLKRLNVSSRERDPALNNGNAYFVEDTLFAAFIKTYEKRVADETSSCNKHDALELANIRGGKGTDSSGVGAVVCSRHDMKRGTAVINLKKGEKYIYMDYAVCLALRSNAPPDIVLSYDIACQWRKKFGLRIAMYPEWLRPPQPAASITYLIPKFHLPAHIAPCRYLYSFNYTPGVGRTDGEAPERGWAASNGAAASTKEMGPGSRLDTLDDHFGDQNWRKFAWMPHKILKKIKEAVKQREEHVVGFVGFEMSIENQASIPEWRRAVLKWEQDPHGVGAKANPFIPVVRQLSDAAVRLQLAQEEATRTSDIHVRHDVGPCDFLVQGLHLEDMQVRLKKEVTNLGNHPTDRQKANIQQKCNCLRRRIEAWFTIQGVYMPASTVQRIALATSSTPVQAYDVPLLLPSAIACIRTDLDRVLAHTERRLRFGRAQDTLGMIRENILVRGGMYRVKEREVRGQAMVTRAATVLNRIDAHIEDGFQAYQRHWNALEKLSVPLECLDHRMSLRALNKTDMVNIDDSDGSEGRRTLSWIWMANVHLAGSAGLQDALRIEWCKSRARARRWQEDAELQRVEMVRYLETLSSEIAMWETRAAGEGAECTRNIPGFVEGARAYALRQAARRRAMHANAQILFSRAPGDHAAVIDATGDPALDYLDVTQHVDTLSMYSPTS
ncbi:hypothetical protein BDZ89DRAFT_1140448 [Hymenopellis radicata]|nr:hypothetical protein BDZ89DRAFT_1140448 [Hymenopellis radicata]